MTRQVIAWLLVAIACAISGPTAVHTAIGMVTLGTQGVGAVSMGASGMPMAVLFVVMLHVATWQLTNCSTSRRLAQTIRFGHIAVTTLIIASGFVVTEELALILFTSVQPPFLTAAVAFSIAHSRC